MLFRSFSGLLDTLEEAVVLRATSSGFLVRVMAKDLLAVGAFDLLLSGLVSVFRQTENGVVILALRMTIKFIQVTKDQLTNLPILRISSEHHWVFRFADLAGIIILDLLGTFLCLDSIVLGKCALVASPTSMSEEMRSNGLDAALSRSRDAANGFKIFLGRPALREDRQWESDLRMGGHGNYLVGGDRN